MRNLLITGFDPFGGESTNPSWEAVRRLPDTVGDFMLCKLQIPTVFGLAAEKCWEPLISPNRMGFFALGTHLSLSLSL